MCVRACMRCVCACVRACVCACVCINIYVSTCVDIYAGAVGESPKIDELLQKLKSRIDYELIFQQQVFQLLGAMDMIFAASLPRPTIPSETRTSTD